MANKDNKAAKVAAAQAKNAANANGAEVTNGPTAGEANPAAGGDVAHDADRVLEPEKAVGQNAPTSAPAAPAGGAKTVKTGTLGGDPRDKRITALECQSAKLISYIEFLHANHPNKLLTLKQWEAKTNQGATT